MPFPTLPPELWREIVSLATYTLTCFDTSPHPGTWNPLSDDFLERYEANFRTKRALAFVSRYDPAAGISFKQLGRIAPLIPYLPTTQHIMVDFTDWVDRNMNDDVVQSLQQILRQYHNLRGLVLSFPISSTRLWHPHIQTQIAMGVCPGLQFLDLRGPIQEHAYETLLYMVSSTLRGCNMTAWTLDDESSSVALTVHHPRKIIFPHLNSFRWCALRGPKYSFSKFNMSALTYLVIQEPSTRNILTQILESARHSILSLRLDGRCNVDNDVLSIALRAPCLRFLGYSIEPPSVAWLNDQMCHDTLQEIWLEYASSRSPFGTTEEIFRDHFHPISKRRFPMLRTVTVAPMVGPHKVLCVYDLEDGKRLEDADTVRPMKLYFCGPHR